MNEVGKKTLDVQFHLDDWNTIVKWQFFSHLRHDVYMTSYGRHEKTGPERREKGEAN